MSFHTELRNLLWDAFYSGGRWALDAFEKKGEKNPTTAFNEWLMVNWPLLGFKSDDPEIEITLPETSTVETTEEPDAEAP